MLKSQDTHENQDTGEAVENVLDQGANEILMNDRIISDSYFIMKENAIMFQCTST
jgi:hypothetical protein